MLLRLKLIKPADILLVMKNFKFSAYIPFTIR